MAKLSNLLAATFWFGFSTVFLFWRSASLDFALSHKWLLPYLAISRLAGFLNKHWKICVDLRTRCDFFFGDGLWIPPLRPRSRSRSRYVFFNAMTLRVKDRFRALSSSAYFNGPQPFSEFLVVSLEFQKPWQHKLVNVCREQPLRATYSLFAGHCLGFLLSKIHITISNSPWHIQVVYSRPWHWSRTCWMIRDTTKEVIKDSARQVLRRPHYPEADP